MRLWVLGLISILLTFWLCYCSYQLVQSNPGLDCNNLKPGDTLCLALKGEDCQDTLTVEAGNTCEQIIANKNGLNSTTFHKNNPQLSDLCEIYIGMVRCVFLFPLSHRIFGFYIIAVDSGFWSHTPKVFFSAVRVLTAVSDRLFALQHGWYILMGLRVLAVLRLHQV